MLLTVSAAAIALPASASSRFQLRLQSVECVGVAINFYVTAVVTRRECGGDMVYSGSRGTHLMEVIVLLTLSISAIAAPTSGPRSFKLRLQAAGA